MASWLAPALADGAWFVTSTIVEAVALPALLVAVTMAVNAPVDGYVCEGLLPVPVAPSPKLHW